MAVLDIPELMNMMRQDQAQKAELGKTEKMRSKLTYKDGKVSAEIYPDEIDKLPEAFKPFLNQAAQNAGESQTVESDMNRMRQDQIKSSLMKASQESVKADIEAQRQTAAGNLKFGPDINPFASTYEQKAEEKRRAVEALRGQLELSYDMSKGRPTPLMSQETVSAAQAQPISQPITQAETAQPKSNTEEVRKQAVAAMSRATTEEQKKKIRDRAMQYGVQIP